MRVNPDGLSRNRHVEITTKSGNTVAGLYRRSKTNDSIGATTIYLRFKPKDEDVIVDVAVELDDVDTIIIGPKRDLDDADDAAE